MEWNLMMNFAQELFILVNGPLRFLSSSLNHPPESSTKTVVFTITDLYYIVTTQ